jgi:hypothetical protein
MIQWKLMWEMGIFWSNWLPIHIQSQADSFPAFSARNRFCNKLRQKAPTDAPMVPIGLPLQICIIVHAIVVRHKNRKLNHSGYFNMNI